MRCLNIHLGCLDPLSCQSRGACDEAPAKEISMYRDERWDAERRVLWLRHSPNGPWMAATAQQTIDWLADHLELLKMAFKEHSDLYAAHSKEEA